MKRFFSCFVALMICCNMFVHNVQACDSEQEYTIEHLNIARDILEVLEVWKDFDETSPYLTRAEVAVLACMWYGEYNDSDWINPDIIYDDVPNSHWAYKYINRISAFSISEMIMSGDGNGKFRPDDYILYQEFVKVFLGLSGWSKYCEYYTVGYPLGYLDTSNLLGAYPNYKGKEDQWIKKSDAIIYIYNIMNIPEYHQLGFSTYRNHGYDDNHCMLSTFREIYQVRGYIDEINNTALIIDGKVYYGDLADDCDKSSLVLCFYKTDKEERNNIIKYYIISSENFDSKKSMSKDLPNDIPLVPMAEIYVDEGDVLDGDSFVFPPEKYSQLLQIDIETRKKVADYMKQNNYKLASGKHLYKKNNPSFINLVRGGFIFEKIPNE